MRSRSYYAIAGSSFLLLTISCMTQGTKVEEKKADVRPTGETVPVGSEAGDEGDVKKDIAFDDTGSPFHGMLPVGDTGEAVAQLPDHIQQMVDEPPDMVCPTGEMDFEGKCVNKEEVDKVLHKRKKIALDKVKTAKRPKQTADASYDLLEQQTAQVDKVEDDLDEIIEQLKEEKKAEALEKKKKDRDL
jgi:hypothetical protein